MVSHLTTARSLDRPSFDDDRAIIDTLNVHPKDAISYLSGVGLADPFTWARSYGELSNGQQARYAIAHAYSQRPGLIDADEFLTTLDSTTARAAAWSIARFAEKRGITIIATTARDDITRDFCPDVIVDCTFGKEPSITYKTTNIARCTLHEEIEFRPGTIADWRALQHFHYAAHELGTIHSIYVANRSTDIEPLAIVVLAYPPLQCAARNLATDDAYHARRHRDVFQTINREVLRMSRIVVVPEYRGIGLAQRLIAHAISQTTARYIECSTAMARYSPFLKNAGFREVPTCTSDAELDLRSYAAQTHIPETMCIHGSDLEEWIDAQSVRVRRQGRRIVWKFYFTTVLHKRSTARPPRKIPNPSNRHWPAAWSIAAQHLVDAPSYWIIGPLNTGVKMPS